MKIITTAEALVAALKQSMAPEKKSPIPILSYAKVTAEDVTVTDLDESTVVPLKAKGKGTVMLNVRQVLDVLNKETGVLEIEFNELKQVSTASRMKVVESDRVKLSVNGCVFAFDRMIPANFPQLPPISTTLLTIDGKEFKKLLTRTMFAISNEESRYTLNGALLITFQDEVKMIATDGHRLSVATLPMKGPGEFKGIIRRAALNYLKSRIGDTVEIGQDEHTQTFRTGGITLFSRRLTGTFPTWEAVLPRDKEQKMKVLVKSPSAVASIITRVAKCADERSGCIKLRFGLDSQVSASSSERGSATAPLDIHVSENMPAIGVNNEYILEFIKAIGDEPFEISMKDSQSPLLLSMENFQYVVMPMRT